MVLGKTIPETSANEWLSWICHSFDANMEEDMLNACVGGGKGVEMEALLMAQIQFAVEKLGSYFSRTDERLSITLVYPMK